jgi:DNA replication protein DnaC
MQRSVKRPRLLIFNELAYLPMSQDYVNLIFQVIVQRYEKGYIILTFNLPVGW